MEGRDDTWESLRGPLGRRRGANYIWLIYSGFFFIDPVMMRNAGYWVRCLEIYAVFLAMYVMFVEYRSRTGRRVLLAAMMALGLATMPFNGGASSFLILAVGMLPFLVPSVPIAAGWIGLVAASVGVEWMVVRHDPVNYTIAVLLLAVVGGGNVMLAEQRRAECRLRAVQEENLALAGVAERERIARDLHDVLGHTLSVIVLKAELAGRLIGRDDARAASEIADVEQTARTALAEVRETIGGIRTKGLVAEVEQARRTLDAAGVVLECECAPPTMGATQETVLSLAVREAVTNIVRHAGATRCTLRFASAGGGFRALTVEDDGCGVGTGEGNGLRGMRERVQALGGRFRVESGGVAVGGTRVVIELPDRPG